MEKQLNRAVSNNDHRWYQTENLTLASYLVCAGFTPSVVTAARPGRAVFRFPKSPELDAEVLKFASGEARIAPASFDMIKQELIQQARIVRDRSREGGGVR